MTDTHLAEHQRAWASSTCVKKFDGKAVDDFFRTETFFLDEIGPQLSSVLDIGCASGRFASLIEHYAADFEYTGADLVAEGVNSAQRNLPQHRFLVGNALELEIDSTFQLVNATGVVQHEPRFHELIERMLMWSSRYVLFDLKAAPVSEHLIDWQRSFVTIGDDRLYFVVLSYRRLLAWLAQIPGLARIRIYGYETQPNARTTVPTGLGPVASLGVLLELGEPPSNGVLIEAEVPAFLATAE